MGCRESTSPAGRPPTVSLIEYLSCHASPAGATDGADILPDAIIQDPQRHCETATVGTGSSGPAGAAVPASLRCQPSVDNSSSREEPPRETPRPRRNLSKLAVRESAPSPRGHMLRDGSEVTSASHSRPTGRGASDAVTGGCQVVRAQTGTSSEQHSTKKPTRSRLSCLGTSP